MSLLDAVKQTRGSTPQNTTYTTNNSSGSSLLRSVQSTRGEQVQPISGSLDEKKGGFISKTKKVLGIGTGEWKQLGSNVKEKSQGFLQDIGYRDQQGTLKDDAKNWVKDVYNNTKDKIVEAVKKKEADKQAYFGDMTDITKLNYEQIRDYESNHFLELVEEDLRQDLNRLQDKKDKSWGDNYRIKNYSKTLEKIDEAKNIPADQKHRFDSFINGLAIARGSSAITAGLLNIGESFFDFVKWRGDMAEAEELSEFSEKAGDRVNIWAEEVRPNNPQFADSLLEGIGSTIPFYVTSLGISSVAGRISTVSPAIAKAIGIGSSAFMEAGLEAGSTYQTLIDMGYDKEESDLRASRVFVGNAIYNYFTDKYGLFNDEVGVKKVIQAGLGEGFQETWQNGLQNIATDGNFWENAGETFLMSFITGAFLTNFGDPVVQDQTINDQDLAKLQKIQEEIKKEVGKQQEIDTKQGVDTKVAQETQQNIQPQTEITIENLSSIATNSLENKEIGVKPGAIENAKKEILAGITPPIKIRTIEDGSIVIEDGRHHLEALRQLGVENYKNYPIEDVTRFYEPKKAEVEQGEVSEPKIKEAVEENLTKEAQKYKSAEEFVNKYQIEESFDMTPGVTRISDTSETGLYHGAGVTNLKSILNDEKLITNVSKLDSLSEKVISSSGNRSVANSYGVVFELDENIPKRIAPKEAIKGDVYDAFEYRIDSDVPFNKIKSVTIPLDKADGVNTKIMWDYSGKNPEYISAKELADKFREKGIKVFFDDGTSFSKSQLTDIWNKANKETKAPEKKPETVSKKESVKTKAETKASKVAVSIEQNLNERFENLAGFETRNVKSQAKLVSKLIAKDINKARDIVTGKEPLPAGISGSMFIAGVEQYATENNDIDLLRSLAVSPLVSETSVHAQELRFLAERDKTSVLSKIQELANERAKIFKKNHKDSVEKAIKKETAKIKESVKVSKWDWNSFIKSIEC